MSKILFFSDAHGCAGALEEFTTRVREEAPDLIVFLGDALYHGPRNMIQGDYEPKKATELLNALAPKLLAVRGNCDAEVDQMLLRFPCMSTYSEVLVDGQRLFLTHGHIWNAEETPPLPENEGIIIASGHTHVPRLEVLENGNIALNPGSISIPKGGSVPSYAVYQEKQLALKSLYTGEAYLLCWP